MSAALACAAFGVVVVVAVAGRVRWNPANGAAADGVLLRRLPLRSWRLRPQHHTPVARLLDELHALLAAGVDSRTAWLTATSAEARSHDDPVLSAIHAALRTGRDVPGALQHGRPAASCASTGAHLVHLQWCWSVLNALGSPATDVIHHCRDVAYAQEQSAAARAQSLAAPLATVRVLGTLPLFGTVLGYVLGANPVGVLVGSPTGWVLATLGLCCGLVVLVWIRWLWHAARSGGDDHDALVLGLVATGLGAGTDADTVLRHVLRSAPHGVSRNHLAPLRHVTGLRSLGASWPQVSESCARASRVAAVLARAMHVSSLTGAPAAQLLVGAAQQSRDAAARETLEKANALGVKLVVPIALTGLPAFACLVVAPILLDIGMSLVSSG